MDFDKSNSSAKPFLKWAGGKRALLPEIYKRIPYFDGRYFEPFLGAGAALISLPIDIPKIGNDFNGELIGVFKTIRDNTDELIEELKKHRNTKEHFLRVRAWDRKEDYSARSEIQKAARFIYLNKTCFNGLYRVNSSGQFNVPYGHQSKPEIYSRELLYRISDILNGIDQSGNKVSARTILKTGDYRNVTEMAKAGDFLYFDPPYDPLSTTASFVSYQKEGFGRNEQLELRDELVRLTELRIPVLLSNSDTTFIRKIYRESGLFRLETIQVRRAISASASGRGMVPELFVSNYRELGIEI